MASCIRADAEDAEAGVGMATGQTAMRQMSSNRSRVIRTSRDLSFPERRDSFSEAYEVS
jgi:hypothetical protein